MLSYCLVFKFVL
uniref:Uncharacterized protein n=1 Tax=Anguilla anguilla TaxID=7936 RepID=A0A0E9V537_ANGAN